VARLPRLTLAGHVHLVMQRAPAGMTVFRDADDHRLYLQHLRDLALEQRVAVHAYCLTPSQVLLLLTPSTDDGIGRMQQALGRRFGAAYNRRHARSGVLWEGRFRCTLVDPAQHLIDAIRFVESAPQREGLTALPAEHPWSSLGHHLGQVVDPLLTEHPAFWALGNTPFDREAAYRRVFDQGLSAPLVQRVEHATRMGWALGSATFVAALAEVAPRRVAPLGRGRPKGAAPKKPDPK